jgi:trans-aconitate 2-methyltransferase
VSWDPDTYLAFSAPRLRPAVDLLAHIEGTPKLVVDLGCGPGNVTRLLRLRWPEARLIGVDISAEMLAQAPDNCPDTEWLERDIAAWQPETPPDVIYANAALQWLPDHETLLPRLLAALAPGGTLAVQMPRNHEAPWSRLMEETAAEPRFAAALPNAMPDRAVAAPAVYYGLLAPAAEKVSIWETEYLQVLDGPDPVLTWTRGTSLRPYLDALPGALAGEFEAAYGRRLRAAYPARPDGTTLFPFRRLFILARR